MATGTITSTGIGSNLDIEGLVTKLMSVEQRPLTALATKESAYQAKISAFGLLKSAISSLQTAAASLMPNTGSTALDKFSVFKTTVSDSAIASATATAKAVPGTYSLEVTQLAQQNRLATLTGSSSPFDSSGKLVGGGGTLTISLGTLGAETPNKSTAINIADGATAEDIRDAINAAGA